MLTRIKRAIQTALYPDRCLSCGLLFHVSTEAKQTSLSGAKYFKDAPIRVIYENELAQFLCPSCIRDFPAIHASCCSRCGKEFESDAAEDHLCGDCIQKDPPYQRIRSAGKFKGSLMEAIHRLKYAGKIQLAGPLGRVLFGAFLNGFQDAMIDLIIPVPLHASKLKARGFNQVMVMLREWPFLAAGIHASCPAIDFQSKTVIRKKKTKSQTGLGKENRKTNVRGAFSVLNPDAIQGKQVLLVDDVYTTGATTEECAKTLVKNGAGGVYILTLARAG